MLNDTQRDDYASAIYDLSLDHDIGTYIKNRDGSIETNTFRTGDFTTIHGIVRDDNGNVIALYEEVFEQPDDGSKYETISEEWFEDPTDIMAKILSGWV